MDADRAIERMDDAELIECPACHGSRLNPIASAVRLEGCGVSPKSQIASPSPSPTSPPLHRPRLQPFLQTHLHRIPPDTLIARDILPEIRQRLSFLQEVGLGYLQLDRSGNTLSGGESQRIRLAAQLGSNLRGVLYVLDEPTIGLHPRDNAALLKTLITLRDHGNSLIIVEHDEDTIAARRSPHRPRSRSRPSRRRNRLSGKAAASAECSVISDQWKKKKEVLH